MKNVILIAGIILFFLTSCKQKEEPERITMDQIAESYVKLVLKVGLYDPDFVDAYYGPEEWRPDESKKEQIFPYEEFKWKITHLLESMEEVDTTDWTDADWARQHFLARQMKAVWSRMDMIHGDTIPFNKESKYLYDAIAPHYPATYYDSLLEILDKAIPGSGNLADRYAAFRNQLVIPEDKLDDVFQAAIAEARKRTMEYIDLPENESFDLEYVKDKPWSGYNWYKGNNHSLIQINTDLPIYIDRAIDLASHEGYPGHHVFNVLIESQLVEKKGWKEYSVYPLFSPQSLIAEGSANFGINVAFPAEERIIFEKEVLYPLAGIDPALAETYHKIQGTMSKLSYAGNEAARSYLSGEISREEAAEWLVKYNLNEPERALQRTRFFDKYRSYVINYNLGKDLVKEYVESKGGTPDNPAVLWEVFEELLYTPLTASSLAVEK